MVEYAKDMLSGKIPVNKARKDAAKRFLQDLENPDYSINELNVNLVIFLIEHTFKHIKGSARGKSFILEMWQKWIIFNLVGFELKGTTERRFKEAFIFIPRKNSKTFFASALAWALSILEKDNYAVLYIIATKLDRALEAFNNILDNIRLMGEEKNFRILDSNSEHSISRQFGKTGAVKIQALAADAKRADGLNANIIILDEIHGYKSPNDYHVYKQAMKAYVNKLLIGITTAGADMNSFCYQRLQYCRDVASGKAKDEQYFVFICEADDPNDYTNPYQHEIANPNYRVTIRPEDIQTEANQAQANPIDRAEFLNKSLNVYVDTLDSYFNVDEVIASDNAYDWTIDELSKLPIQWYGGADLSKLHDLTGVGLYGCYEDVDIFIPHAFIPRTEARVKANDDNIPVFGWEEDGWLTLTNSKAIQFEEVVDWFVQMRNKGFNIMQVGTDPRFSDDFYPLMDKAHIPYVDVSQRYANRTIGARHIENRIKNKKFYYLHSEAYLYCIRNVKFIERPDDSVIIDKVHEKSRIDLFDASVNACVEMVKNKKNLEQFDNWLNHYDQNNKK